MDNNKNNDNKENKDLEKGLKASNTFFWWLLVLMLISSFFSALSTPVNSAEKELVVNLESATVQTVKQDTTFTCVKYEPFFDKDGNKSYDVRFRSNNSDLFFEVRVDASEVDELGRVIEDAKYEGTITYAYIDKAFEDAIKDLEGEEIDKRIIGLVSSKTPYAKYSEIAEIDFLYIDEVEEYSLETATDNLLELIAEKTNQVSKKD